MLPRLPARSSNRIVIAKVPHMSSRVADWRSSKASDGIRKPVRSRVHASMANADTMVMMDEAMYGFDIMDISTPEWC